jgi:hypothetical protein
VKVTSVNCAKSSTSAQLAVNAIAP